MRILNWLESPDATSAAAVKCLRHGGLVAFPTDTLYGLAVDPSNDEAVQRLFRAKRRSLDAPLPILVASPEEAGEVARVMPALALRLGDHFWPGPLTMVLERSLAFRSLALGGSDSVALRVPDHAVPLALIRGLARAITGTSANKTGEAPPRTAIEVVHQLDGDVDIIIDAGPCPLGVESTVIDLTEDPPHLLREGAVSRAELEAIASVRFNVAES
jgi:L-threonylcarbamoyladenylate synthase